MASHGISTFANIRNRIYIYKNWYKIIFPFNRWFKGIQQLRLRNGKSAYVRSVAPGSMDVSIVTDILGNKEYDIAELQLPPDATVIDLGANIGTFAIEIHRMFPTAKIIAYEPHLGNCLMFRINAPYATLIEKAVAEKTGKVYLENHTNYVGLRLTKEGGVEVEAQSLDDILKDIDTVDLLKVDIEGSEYEVFQTTSFQTLKKVRSIIMEVHPFDVVPNQKLWAEEILSKHGFKTHWIIGRTSVIYGNK